MEIHNMIQQLNNQTVITPNEIEKDQDQGFQNQSKLNGIIDSPKMFNYNPDGFNTPKIPQFTTFLQNPPKIQSNDEKFKQFIQNSLYQKQDPPHYVIKYNYNYDDLIQKYLHQTKKKFLMSKKSRFLNNELVRYAQLNELGIQQLEENAKQQLVKKLTIINNSEVPNTQYKLTIEEKNNYQTTILKWVNAKQHEQLQYRLVFTEKTNQKNIKCLYSETLDECLSMRNFMIIQRISEKENIKKIFKICLQKRDIKTSYNFYNQVLARFKEQQYTQFLNTQKNDKQLDQKIDNLSVIIDSINPDTISFQQTPLSTRKNKHSHSKSLTFQESQKQPNQQLMRMQTNVNSEEEEYYKNKFQNIFQEFKDKIFLNQQQIPSDIQQNSILNQFDKNIVSQFIQNWQRKAQSDVQVDQTTLDIFLYFNYLQVNSPNQIGIFVPKIQLNIYKSNQKNILQENLQISLFSQKQKPNGQKQVYKFNQPDSLDFKKLLKIEVENYFINFIITDYLNDQVLAEKEFKISELFLNNYQDQIQQNYIYMNNSSKKLQFIFYFDSSINIRERIDDIFQRQYQENIQFKEFRYLSTIHFPAVQSLKQLKIIKQIIGKDSLEINFLSDCFDNLQMIYFKKYQKILNKNFFKLQQKLQNWQLVLNNKEELIQNNTYFQKILQLSIDGVPHCIRDEVWSWFGKKNDFISKIQQKIKQNEINLTQLYQQLVILSSNYKNKITNNEKIQEIFQVFLYYINEISEQKIIFCQELVIIAQQILQFARVQSNDIKLECRVFFALLSFTHIWMRRYFDTISIRNEYNLDSLQFFNEISQPVSIKEDIIVLKYLISTEIPDLYIKFQQINFPFEIYFAEKILAAYSNFFNPELTQRIWDLLFLLSSNQQNQKESMQILVCTCLVFLLENKSAILLCKDLKQLIQVIEIKAQLQSKFDDFILKIKKKMDYHFKQVEDSGFLDTLKRFSRKFLQTEISSFIKQQETLISEKIQYNKQFSVNSLNQISRKFLIGMELDLQGISKLFDNYKEMVLNQIKFQNLDITNKHLQSMQQLSSNTKEIFFKLSDFSSNYHTIHLYIHKIQSKNMFQQQEIKIIYNNITRNILLDDIQNSQIYENFEYKKGQNQIQIQINEILDEFQLQIYSGIIYLQEFVAETIQKSFVILEEINIESQMCQEGKIKFLDFSILINSKEMSVQKQIYNTLMEGKKAKDVFNLQCVSKKLLHFENNFITENELQAIFYQEFLTQKKINMVKNIFQSFKLDHSQSFLSFLDFIFFLVANCEGEYFQKIKLFSQIIIFSQKGLNADENRINNKSLIGNFIINIYEKFQIYLLPSQISYFFLPENPMEIYKAQYLVLQTNQYLDVLEEVRGGCINSSQYSYSYDLVIDYNILQQIKTKLIIQNINPFQPSKLIVYYTSNKINRKAEFIINDKVQIENSKPIINQELKTEENLIIIKNMQLNNLYYPLSDKYQLSQIEGIFQGLPLINYLMAMDSQKRNQDIKIINKEVQVPTSKGESTIFKTLALHQYETTNTQWLPCQVLGQIYDTSIQETFYYIQYDHQKDKIYSKTKKEIFVGSQQIFPVFDFQIINKFQNSEIETPNPKNNQLYDENIEDDAPVINQAKQEFYIKDKYIQ